MGYRTGSWAKIWEVDPKTDASTTVRLSISRKNKKSGEYETDFSGFVTFVGSACAKAAASLKKGDTIKLGDVDVTTFYSKEKSKEYTNFKCFNFEVVDNNSNGEPHHIASDTPNYTVQQDFVNDTPDHQLPF